MEAEGVVGWQGFPIFPGTFQHHDRTNDIGLNKLCGAVERSVQMRFCGQMHDNVGLIFAEHALDEVAVADIAVHGLVELVLGNGVEDLKITPTDELIEVHHPMINFINQKTGIPESIKPDQPVVKKFILSINFYYLTISYREAILFKACLLKGLRLNSSLRASAHNLNWRRTVRGSLDTIDLMVINIP